MPDVTPSMLGTMVSQSTLPVLVSFQASWAKAMAPTLSDIAAEATGQLQAIQIDVSVYPQIAERFKVRIIPTLLIFKHGVPVEFIVGLVPSRFIRQYHTQGYRCRVEKQCYRGDRAMLKLCRSTSKQQRACLRCDRRFLSAGPQNRLCQTCRDALAGSGTPEESYPLVFLRESAQGD